MSVDRSDIEWVPTPGSRDRCQHAVAGRPESRAPPYRPV